MCVCVCVCVCVCARARARVLDDCVHAMTTPPPFFLLKTKRRVFGHLKSVAQMVLLVRAADYVWPWIMAHWPHSEVALFVGGTMVRACASTLLEFAGFQDWA